MLFVSALRPDRLALSHHEDDTISVRIRTFALVEQAVAAHNVEDAVALLAQRPGDLSRLS